MNINICKKKNRPKYFHPGKITFAMFLTAFLIFAAGCNEDHTKGTPFDKTVESDTPTSTEAAIPSDSAGNTSGSKKDVPTDIIKSGTSDSTLSESHTNTDKDPAADTSTPSPASTADITVSPEAEPTTAADDPTPTPDVTNAGLDRNEFWDKTFLIWLPMFTAGQLDNIDYAGTYDYATFSHVSRDDITAYISTLKDSGFINISIENYSDDAIAFIASKDNSWEVRVTYTGQSLVLGSGFNDGNTDDEDKTDSLYSTTMLQYVPRFNKGSYISSESRSDGSMYTSIVYTDVSKEDTLSYIEAVKQKGYVYVEDEGESDGTLWYIAINDEKFECHVEFSGRELKIGCGYMEED